MRVTFQIDPSDMAKFQKRLAAARKQQRKNNEQTMAFVADSVAHELVNQTYPLGTTAAKLKPFQNNIARQVFKGAMRSNKPNVKDAHNSARDNRGRVSGKLYYVKGHPQFKETGGEDVVKEQKAKAGFLKAGWVVAGRSIRQVFGKYFPTNRRYPALLNRHAKNKDLGSVSKYSFGGIYRIIIKNNVRYAAPHNVRVSVGLRKGMSKALSRLKSIFKTVKTTL